MSLEDFQLVDNEPIDDSIVKRDFSRTYHQQGANLNNPDQNFEFIFGENNNYHQRGNSYLEIDITVRDPIAGSNNNAEIRMVNNGFAFGFKERNIATTGGMEIEDVNFFRTSSKYYETFNK